MNELKENPDRKWEPFPNQNQTMLSPPRMAISIENQRISVPQTPQGIPAPSGAMQEHDLPPELLQQGWRKFWSKRENRPYFWNKVTGESLWETPALKNQFDPITDPLGISATPGPVSLKRRASEDCGPAVKKFVLSGPWDLEVNTNIIIFERPHTIYTHPHPEIEAFR